MPVKLSDRDLAIPTYDRAGKRITFDQYLRYMEDFDYRIVKQETVGAYWVSTVWLGLDHGFGYAHAPIIFETMVFAQGEVDDPTHTGLHDMDCYRYATEREAVAGHEATVLLIRGTQEEVPGT